MLTFHDISILLCISSASSLRLSSPQSQLKQCADHKPIPSFLAGSGLRHDCHGIEKDLPETQEFLRLAAQRCFHFADYLSEYQTPKFPLTADMVRAAMTPNGHTGSWFDAAEKFVNALKDKRKIQIAVLGGSMTKGDGLQVNDHDAWPFRLKRILANDAEITNLAVAATTSEYPLMHFQNLYKRLSASDIVILDYAVNDFNSEGALCCALGHHCSDWQKCNNMKDPPTYPRTNTPANMASLKTLVRALASLPKKPAVVFLETFQNNLGYTCDVNVTKHAHWSVIEAFDLPVISYKDAFCETGRTMWMEPSGKTGQDTQAPHPSAATHELVAHLVGGALNMNARRGCEMEPGDLHGNRIAPIEPSNFECLFKPTAILNEYKDFASAADDVIGWRWFEDKPGKPGWIAEGKENKITFPLQVQHGEITIEFLSTYENIGSVDCSIDAEDSCQIQGLWGDKSSQSSFVTLATTLKGQVHLTCKADGRKFKIISISAC